jgi:hypothetical protein
MRNLMYYFIFYKTNATYLVALTQWVILVVRQCRRYRQGLATPQTLN